MKQQYTLNRLRVETHNDHAAISYGTPESHPAPGVYVAVHLAKDEALALGLTYGPVDPSQPEGPQQFSGGPETATVLIGA